MWMSSHPVLSSLLLYPSFIKPETRVFLHQTKIKRRYINLERLHEWFRELRKKKKINPYYGVNKSLNKTPKTLTSFIKENVTSLISSIIINIFPHQWRDESDCFWNLIVNSTFEVIFCLFSMLRTMKVVCSVY